MSEALKKRKATTTVKKIKMQTKKTINQLSLEKNGKSTKTAAARDL